MCDTGNSDQQCNNDNSEQCNTNSKYHINNDDDLFRRKHNLYSNTGQWRNNTNLCMEDKRNNSSRSDRSNIYDNDPCEQ